MCARRGWAHRVALIADGSGLSLALALLQRWCGGGGAVKRLHVASTARASAGRTQSAAVGLRPASGPGRPRRYGWAAHPHLLLAARLEVVLDGRGLGGRHVELVPTRYDAAPFRVQQVPASRSCRLRRDRRSQVRKCVLSEYMYLMGNELCVP